MVHTYVQLEDRYKDGIKNIGFCFFIIVYVVMSVQQLVTEQIKML